jgi:hypothetical protein
MLGKLPCKSLGKCMVKVSVKWARDLVARCCAYPRIHLNRALTAPQRKFGQKGQTAQVPVQVPVPVQGLGQGSVQGLHVRVGR